MIDKFEFGNFKQVRKTLLVFSLIGFSFKELAAYSKGNIEFLSFKIPVENADIIPILLGYVIVFYVAAFIIRYNDDKFQKKYKSFEERILGNSKNLPDIYSELGDTKLKRFLRIKSLFVLDIIFPLLFGFVTIYKIFYT